MISKLAAGTRGAEVGPHRQTDADTDNGERGSPLRWKVSGKQTGVSSAPHRQQSSEA